MADFFSGVYGARFPDVVMNQGPLPGTGGLPNPLHDTVDGRINYNSSLLGDIEPYAYGEPGYLSSQNSYLNIPHRIQKIVPCLYLPEPNENRSFTLSHPIDDGDISFTMRLDRNSEVCSGLSNRSMLRAGLGTAIDPMINLCTLNYILAGVQICTQIPTVRNKWDQFLHHLDKKRFNGTAAQAYNYSDIKHIVRHLIKPFGVAHGSEKQGGQHEGTMSSVQWPVSFVVSLILDGKDANVVNIWNFHDVEAGNDLVLRLKAVPLPPGGKFTLNHYPKSLTEKSFTPGLLRQMVGVPGPVITHVWQLVPDIFSLDMESPRELLDDFAGLNPAFLPELQNPGAPDLAWQQEGYWHVARAQIHSRKYGLEAYYYNDLANNLRTGHMDVTFQPVFYAVPFRSIHDQNALPVGVREPGAPQNVFNRLGSVVGDKRNRQEMLRLDQGFGSARGGEVLDGWGGPGSDNGYHDYNAGRRSMGYDSIRELDMRFQGGESDDSGIPRRSRNNGSTVRVNQCDHLIDQRINHHGSHFQGSSASIGSNVGSSASNFSNESNLPGVSVANSTSSAFNSSNMVSGGSYAGSGNSVSGNAGLTEDIGVFDDPGPLMAPISSSAAAGPAPFSVAKPGLKSSAARKSASRGKGVPSSVLAVDGSVTQQQASLL
jgi:hypothetical protein